MRWSLLGWQMWLHAYCPLSALETDTSGYWIPVWAELISCMHKQPVKENINIMCAAHGPVTHSLAKPRREIVKDEVGVGLGHGAYVWYIMSHYHVVKREISCGSKWQVAYHQSICKIQKIIKILRAQFAIVEIVMCRTNRLSVGQVLDTKVNAWKVELAANV